MNEAAEKAVIGMMVRDFRALEEVVTRLKASDFESPLCQEIFKAAAAAHEAKRPVDVPSLGMVLSPESTVALIGLVDEAPVAQNVSFYAEEVATEAWRQRTLRELSDITRQLETRRAFDDTGPLIARIEGLKKHQAETHTVDSSALAENIAPHVLTAVEERVLAFRAGKPYGISTGIKLLDKHVFGWLPGWVYTIGARPGAGKTTIGVNFALAAADAGEATAFYTFEMSATEIADKMISRIGRIDFGNYMRGKLDERDLDRVYQATSRFASLPLYVRDVAKPYLERISRDLKRLKAQHGIKLAIIDYGQQLYSERKSFSSRHQELTFITSQIKALAREIQLPIIMLAQLNRKSEEDDEPNMTHLKDSGSFEQDSDVVMLLWKDPKYDTRWLSIAKQRKGVSGKFPIATDLATNYFGNATEET